MSDHSFTLSTADLMTISAALQVYYNTAPEFGHVAFEEHDSLFPDDISETMEADIKDLMNRVNTPLTQEYPGEDWQEEMGRMPLKERRIAVLGTHAVAGSRSFREMAIGVLEQMVSVIDVLADAPDPIRPNIRPSDN